MRCDWSARLDARGYHAIAAGKRPDTAARWDCEPTVSEEDGWPEGDRIIAYDPEQPDIQLSLSVGDSIYMSASRKGQAAEIARIESICQDPKGDFWMQNTFFWRPESCAPGEAALPDSNLKRSTVQTIRTRDPHTHSLATLNAPLSLFRLAQVS